MSNLVVVTGAGASHDCASARGYMTNVRPPLTKDLFSNEFRLYFNDYPLVLQAAAEIRHATGEQAEDAIALEDYLRERMAAATSPYTQRRYRQVPLYLQAVINGSSNQPEPDNYNALVSAALDLDEVLFLTLNYDTILDSRLAQYAPIQDMGWYVQTDPRWALVKLHGSVNWGWRIPLLERHATLSGNSIESVNTIVGDFVLEGFPEFDADAIELRLQDGLPARLSDGEHIFYPALALPLGPSDELVCPSDHVRRAREMLDGMDGIDLLVIGYSGLDQEVLRVVSESGNELRRLLVVNGESGGRPAADRIAEAFRSTNWPNAWASRHTFTSLVATGELRRWLAATA